MARNLASPAYLTRDRRIRVFRKQLRANWDVYLMALPGLAFLIFFSYLPMYGIIIAFKKYRIAQGIWGRRMDRPGKLERLTYSFEFKRAFRNTLLISWMKMIMGLPVPIIFALMLNEIRRLPISACARRFRTFRISFPGLWSRAFLSICFRPRRAW